MTKELYTKWLSVLLGQPPFGGVNSEIVTVYMAATSLVWPFLDSPIQGWGEKRLFTTAFFVFESAIIAAMFEQIRFSRPIPYYSQIATPGLAQAVFENGLDPIFDPGWRSSGAENPQGYAHWVSRACGIVCVKMCTEGFKKTVRSVHEWIKLGLDHDGYLIREENGKMVERGWVHAVLADLLQNEGLESRAISASLLQIIGHLQQGKLFIASVSYQLGTRDPVTFKGGHMVVVHGADLQDGIPTMVYLHNPSGRFPDLRADAAIPADRFCAAYTGRGIVSGLT